MNKIYTINGKEYFDRQRDDLGANFFERVEVTDSYKLEQLEKKVKQIKDAHSIQGQNGNWNVNDYMLGLFNGLELALSILEGRSSEYRTNSNSENDEDVLFPEYMQPTIVTKNNSNVDNNEVNKSKDVNIEEFLTKFIDNLLNK